LCERGGTLVWAGGHSCVSGGACLCDSRAWLSDWHGRLIKLIDSCHSIRLAINIYIVVYISCIYFLYIVSTFRLLEFTMCI